jgi:UPF0755 protein
LKKVLGFTFLLLALVAAGLAGAYYYAKKELFTAKEFNAKIEVKRGESLKEITERLSKLGLIEHPELLYYWARYQKIKVKSGCYSFSGRVSPVKVLEELQKGSPCLVEFTIVPGSTIFDVDEVLSAKGFCKKGEVLKLAEDKNFLKEAEVPVLEGFVFPDTYLINRESSCREALKTPVERFHQVVDPLFKNYEPPPKVKKALKEVTSLKIITVASIVEKETSVEKERPLVAAVIYNRLIRGMKVQCDPTVLYALRLKGIEKERLLYKDLKVDSPYNTYLYKGLPPAPICNPSLSSIKAALYPAEVNYLYFVADGKGGHTFSESYNQHLKAVRKFRKWQNGS